MLLQHTNFLDLLRAGHTDYVVNDVALKFGIAFWDYLGSRLGISGQPAVPPLPALVRCRGQPV